MNWLTIVMQALTQIPYVVAGIEAIHGKSVAGATKKQMAMDALGLSTSVAASVDPKDQPAIAAASALASSTIDGVVKVMNASQSKPVSGPTVPSEIEGQPITKAASPAPVAIPGPAAPVPTTPPQPGPGSASSTVVPLTSSAPVVHVPIPAGDHNPEVTALENDSPSVWP